MKKTILTYNVPYSINRLILLFGDLDEYSKVHPLIIRAEKSKTEENTYRILEKPYKYLPIKISYFAAVNINDNEIEYVITKIPFSKLSIQYNF